MKNTEQYRQELRELLTTWSGDNHTLLNNYDFLVSEIRKDFAGLTLTTKGPYGRLAESYFARLNGMSRIPRYGPRAEFSPAARTELVEDLKHAYDFREKAITPVPEDDKRRERIEFLREKGIAAAKLCYGHPDEPWVDQKHLKLALEAYRETVQDLRGASDDSLSELAQKIEDEVIPLFAGTQ